MQVRGREVRLERLKLGTVCGRNGRYGPHARKSQKYRTKCLNPWV